jgi:hypothetical protein
MVGVTTAVLGGESKTRGTFSGRGSRGVLIAWVALAAFAIFLIFTLELPGLVLALISAGVLRLLTLSRGGEHTLLHHVQDRRRMRFIRRHGFQDFAPVDWRPEDLRLTRKTRKQYNAYRDWPDGVDGLHFLEQRPGRAAVAYHYPTDEAPYFSVAFSVDGPIVGLAGDTVLEGVQESFGELMAGWGSRQKLVSGIQVITRMMPADTAMHEAWLDDQLDPAAPPDLVADYSDLLAELSESSFMQRHFVAIRWNKDARFDSYASTHGPGSTGWLRVIEDQTNLAQQRLKDVGYGNVQVLSGPRLAAVIRHLQHPGWSIDQASDVTPATMYLPSHMEWRAVEVGAVVPDPDIPEVLAVETTSWLHRTAQIPVGDMETMERNGLWMAPLLTGMHDQVIRTIAIHIHFVPAQEAKHGARLDVVGDQADLIGMERKGKLIDDGVALALSSASSRLADVSTGTGHHGAVWAGFITISVPNEAAMPMAVSQIEEAADACGINRLDWLDTQQSAAQSLTWPVARALKAPKRTRSAKAMDWVSARTAKESV